MAQRIQITVDSSQFPGAVQKELLECFRIREIRPQFHYDGIKQALRWLAVHEAFSPARRDPGCAAVYDLAFRSMDLRLGGEKRIHVVAIGPGGGQKEKRLLEALAREGRRLTYAPCDVSAPLVITAAEAARPCVGEAGCVPFVCDFVRCVDWAPVLRPDRTGEPVKRLITFFGMLPNLAPEIAYERLRALTAPGDLVLLSANLAPTTIFDPPQEVEYAEAVARVLPQYDNGLTADWLMTFLLDCGIEREDGVMEFGIEDEPGGADLKRIVCRFRFARPRVLRLWDEQFGFSAGDSLLVFFSYRYTSRRVEAWIRTFGFELADRWESDSGEEGVYLCRRTAAEDSASGESDRGNH